MSNAGPLNALDADTVTDKPAETGADVRFSFITWYPSCRRSDALADALGGRSHLIHYFAFKQPLYAPFKYVLQTLTSWRRLWRDRPDVALVAAPPAVAVAAVWLYCKLTGARYVIDAHTGVFDDPRWRWARPLTRFLARGAVTTIVTSEHLAAEVRRWGGDSLVIGTVPVDFPDAVPAELGAGRHVAVINTFSQDEPLADVLAAAARCPEVTFHITGNLKHARTGRAAEQVADKPANVRFTGWVSDHDYAALLRGVDAVLCLTTSDHTMQRGGYEAMALGQPLITSGWALLRETFSRGTCHVDNSPEAIAAAVAETLADRDACAAEMRALAAERGREFTERLGALRARC